MTTIIVVMAFAIVLLLVLLVVTSQKHSKAKVYNLSLSTQVTSLKEENKIQRELLVKAEKNSNVAVGKVSSINEALRNALKKGNCAPFQIPGLKAAVEIIKGL